MRGLDPSTLPLEGTHLIEASAGTGKTYTIASLFVRLLVELEIELDRILVVTFTEAAAAELRTRIRSRIQASLHAYANPDAVDDAALATMVLHRREHRDRDLARLQLSLRGFDEAAISTIHGFCHRVLHDSAFETGVPFETELVADERPLVEEIVRDFWARELYDADPFFVTHLQDRGVTPPRLLSLARLAGRHPHAPIVPRHEHAAHRPDPAAFFEAFGRARQLWLDHRTEVTHLLTAHPGLHIRQYPKAELPHWFQALDGFFRDELPGSTLGFPQLERFSARELDRFTKKDYRQQIPTHPFFDACEAMVEARRPLLAHFEARHLALKSNLIDVVRTQLPLRKRNAALQSFDDILHDLERALLRPKTGKDLAATIRHRYHAALIDEFQDTDPVQYAIFRSIYAESERPVFLIGDPKQAIYGFRGADVFAYLKAKAAVKPRCRHTMTVNWRSDPGLLEAVERLFAVGRPFLIPAIEFIPVSPRPRAEPALRRGDDLVPAFEIRFARREPHRISRRAVRKSPQLLSEWAETAIPKFVAREIARSLDDGIELRCPPAPPRPMRARDIAVLVRKNTQAQEIQVELRQLGIPSVVYGDASVFDSDESDELLRILACAAEPTHSGLLKSAITTELIGVTASELEAMNDDDREWNRWIEAARTWHAIWVERGFIQMFRAMLTTVDAPERVLRLRDGERRMTNLLHLAELLHGATAREHLGPAGLLRWFDEARRGEQARDAEAAKLRLERDDDAVQLITIHRSKGLEFPIVYCPYLWAPDDLRFDEIESLLFHDEDNGERLTLDISHKPGMREEQNELPNVQRARFEKDAEGLRLLYVALTRARHRCVVIWGAFERSHRSALGYLLHAPIASDAPPDPDPEAIAVHLRELDDDAMLEHLRSRAGASWSIRLLDEEERRTPPAMDATIPRLTLRTPRSSLDRSFRTSSFTSMTRAPANTPFDFAEDQDHDELAFTRDPGGSPQAGDRTRLADLPGGTNVGNLFHAVLETLDFTAPAAERRPLVATQLKAFGFDAETWTDPVDAAIDDMLHTPLPPGFQLADVPPRARLAEFGFIMPAGPDESSLAVTRDALANAFAAHPERLPPGYVGRLRRLPFPPLRGFLKGFVDLIVRHDGRFYVADYKTHDLGDDLQDYGADALAEAMAADHYILQAHIYTVAIVRHLRRRIPQFDVTRDFGGIIYLFLRGMAGPSTPSGTGIWFERPPPERIEALDRVFGPWPGAGMLAPCNGHPAGVPGS